MDTTLTTLTTPTTYDHRQDHIPAPDATVVRGPITLLGADGHPLPPTRIKFIARRPARTRHAWKAVPLSPGTRVTLVIDVPDTVLTAANARRVLEGFPDVPTLINRLLYHYAMGMDASAGGYARANRMSAADRQSAARKAAQARWGATGGRTVTRTRTPAPPPQDLLFVPETGQPPPLSPARRRIPAWPLDPGW